MKSVSRQADGNRLAVVLPENLNCPPAAVEVAVVDRQRRVIAIRSFNENQLAVLFIVFAGIKIAESKFRVIQTYRPAVVINNIGIKICRGHRAHAFFECSPAV